MTSFSTRYAKLNSAQKQAVDTLDGPVMVIAGPGTGKTELLSMRVANILQKTDTLPQNILCLTFTESGATAMRKRLVGLMGKDAYKVAIHTFHSFGTEIINTYSNFFYHGADFRAADDLSTYTILRDIFEKLPLDSPIASKMNDEYTHLRDVQTIISELKRSGLTPDELLKLLDHNEVFVDYMEPLVKEYFTATIRGKKAIEGLEDFRTELLKFQPTPLDLPNFTPLATICAEEFSRALDTALELGKTTPITKWKSAWLEKGTTGQPVMKDKKRLEKLRAVSHVYYQYLVEMQNNALYDFDDMILKVVHALEIFPDLRYNLQEQYQYILVDEFQDTNGAQLRILFSLTDNELYEGRPNILIVGDDDQAIYSFQGAEMSNILTFQKQFKDPTIIALTDNYRSTAPILSTARQVITQGENRLETHIASLDKTLTPHKKAKDTKVELVELLSRADEYSWLAEQVKERIVAGQSPENIAILTRNHREITNLLPYFHHAQIAVNYERRDNILDLPPIVMLEQLARVLTFIIEQRYDDLNGLLPELLAHPAWGLQPIHLWKLGLRAHSEQRYWLEVMLESEGTLKEIAEWLIVVAHKSVDEPLEQMIDIMLGTDETQVPEDDDTEPFADAPTVSELYASPLRGYFFPHDALQKNPNEYVSYLNALRLIRQRLRDYRPQEVLRLTHFVEFIDLHRRTGTIITSPRAAAEEASGVHIMTAHKSKGLEFETVFVVNSTDNTWGSKTRSRNRMITYPHNLPISPAGETDDERIRLYFVAMTRAERELILTYATSDLAQKETLRANFLQLPDITPVTPSIDTSSTNAIQQTENAWYENVLATDSHDLRATLQPILDRYKLSATHLNNFLDVTNGGPRAFLLQNLLRFPQAMSPSAAFGSAVHKTLQRAHAHLSATGNRRPVEDVLHDFEAALAEHRLDSHSHSQYLQKGSDALSAFLAQRYEAFHEGHIVERNFSNQGVAIEGAILTGALDLMHIDEPSRTIIVTDYKTGKPATRWQGSSDFEKIKLHKYKQQLMFYKLLVENSRDYGSKYTVDRGVLEFVEPTKDGAIVQLEMEYNYEELQRLQKLIVAIWQRIHALDFPDTSQFEQSYKGMLAFEEYLLDSIS